MFWGIDSPGNSPLVPVEESLRALRIGESCEQLVEPPIVIGFHQMAQLVSQNMINDPVGKADHAI